MTAKAHVKSLDNVKSLHRTLIQLLSHHDMNVVLHALRALTTLAM